MLPTPNYVLMEEVNISYGMHDAKILPAGTFVRPIDFRYLPKHVTEKNSWFDKETEIYCYTRFGIIAIKKNIIRRTG